MMTTNTNTAASSSTISQEYFDELVLENQDVFDCDDEEAVQETITQLQAASSSNTNRNSSLLPRHLSLTHPHHHPEIRMKIKKFRTALEHLRRRMATTTITDHDEDEPISNDNKPPSLSLDTIYETILIAASSSQENENENSNTNNIFPYIFDNDGGYSIYCQLLSQQQHRHLEEEEEMTNATTNNNAEEERTMLLWNTLYEVIFLLLDDQQQQQYFRSSLQNAMPIAMTAWMYTYQTLPSSSSSKILFLTIAYQSMLRCEVNKKLWMKTTTNNISFARILLNTLEMITDNKEGEEEEGFRPDEKDHHQQQIGILICQILTSLCTFDDFRNHNDDNGVIVQAGHSHVQILHEENVVPILHKYLQQTLIGTHSYCHSQCSKAVSSAILALRAMAIQDSIIQDMVHSGCLDTVRAFLHQATATTSIIGMDDHPTTSDYDEQQQQQAVAATSTVTAALGLFRNVCARDDLKTRYCMHEEHTIVPALVQAMAEFPKEALLQEHAAGCVAAMALRQPDNARYLVEQHEVHVHIVAAMDAHPKVVTLQRQAALAIRNLVSRSPELRTKLLLDGETERVLRHVSAAHLACQDEVYAALRDLGITVNSVQVQQDENGKFTIQQGRQMFGEHNPNFRATYD